MVTLLEDKHVLLEKEWARNKNQKRWTMSRKFSIKRWMLKDDGLDAEHERGYVFQR